MLSFIMFKQDFRKKPADLTNNECEQETNVLKIKKKCFFIDDLSGKYLKYNISRTVHFLR